MTNPTPDRTLVWDAPVRVFHWLIVLSFAGAWLTSEGRAWRPVHVTLGYTMAGLLVFRLVWGVVGTRHARFANFVRGPRAAWHYVQALLHGRPEHHAGHNPAGALAIVALLVLIGATAATGWASWHEVGGEWLEELHEAAANTLLAVVIAHLAGVVVGSFAHDENLVRAMFTGRRAVPPDEGIRSAWRTVAALMLAATLGFWALQWQAPPTGSGARAHERAPHDDDD